MDFISVLKVSLLVPCIALACTTALHAFGDTDTSTCSMEMYGNDTAAFWACRTQFAHQSNWFPSPIAGLFSYQVWNGYDGFWQNGAVLETMTNFVANTNGTNRRYLSVINGGERDLYSLLEAYGPYPSFDDMGWYGLAYTRIYEVLGNDMFLQDAKDIFDWCWRTGWDTSGACAGGFYFDNSFASKQTITNAQMLQLTAKLFRITNNTDYKNKMEQIYHYILNNSLINETTYLVADGATYDCTPSNVYGPTYNSGVMIGAMVELYKISSDPSYTDLAFKMAIGVIERSCDAEGILVESCTPTCDEDALMYKGIFVRNIRYLMDVLNDKTKRDYLQSWLELQIESNIMHNMCDEVPITKCNISYKDGPPYFNKSGPVFSPDWRGPFSYGAPMQQTSALDLFISAIQPGTECSGSFCNYDPPNPPPQPLTCNSKPCPEGEDCCEYSPYTSYTCCYTNQHCNNTTGVCDNN
ncbi:uncharacterized protein LOC127878953 [Dreissena polymorpha]|uniref:Mannan endo-1,6-alpha-mannosidase n=1 Tax=Dreissena polymorpha TaxID=45954 RepID=A0A9D4K5F8_DREPO|nr:uncharacterized protein LOC127878953 [Dreissena polymorpha]KAH3833393.1 hypothetical protein DPMN_106700 [Dreissena polymorpha]